jgi:hypothetical protein
VSEWKYARGWSAAVSVIENDSDATKTPSSVAVRCACRRCGARRAAIANSATASGNPTKNCTWIDRDQKCCTTLVVLLRAV